MSGLPDDMDCVLLGNDKRQGTQPMYITSIKNTAISYTISSFLFIIFCFLIFSKTNYTLIQLPLYISIPASILFGITSIILYTHAGNNVAMVLFGIIGIVFTFFLVIYFLFLRKVN